MSANGDLYANSHRRATAQEWAYVLTHCLLHLALGHIREERAGDMVWEPICPNYWWQGPTDWRQLFAESLRDALRSARRETPELQVLILSARSALANRVDRSRSRQLGAQGRVCRWCGPLRSCTTGGCGRRAPRTEESAL